MFSFPNSETRQQWKTNSNEGTNEVLISVFKDSIHCSEVTEAEGTQELDLRGLYVDIHSLHKA